ERLACGADMAVDRGSCRHLPDRGPVAAGGAQSAQPHLAQIRPLAAQGRQPRDHGAVVLRHGAADRPRAARDGQGSAAAQARGGCGKLLDRARAARAVAGDDEGPVLESTREMDFLIELWRFMRVRKKFWLLPILIMMVVFGGLVVLTKGSAIAPFIYTLF